MNAHQSPKNAGVLRNQHVRAAQNIKGAKSYVPSAADRRGNDVQTVREICSDLADFGAVACVSWQNGFKSLPFIFVLHSCTRLRVNSEGASEWSKP